MLVLMRLGPQPLCQPHSKVVSFGDLLYTQLTRYTDQPHTALQNLKSVRSTFTGAQVDPINIDTSAKWTHVLVLTFVWRTLPSSFYAAILYICMCLELHVDSGNLII